MQPPETEDLATLDQLVANKPAWRTPVLQGAIQFAAMALQANWIVDEFDYSIGGISLNIDRSSKYEGLKSSAEQMWSQSVEAKTRTTKFIRGLRQPKYGVGVRSAFLTTCRSRCIKSSKLYLSNTLKTRNSTCKSSF